MHVLIIQYNPCDKYIVLSNILICDKYIFLIVQVVLVNRKGP